MQPLLTPQQVAELLAISARQVRTLTNAGLIRYINVGRGVKLESRRYQMADVEAYVQSAARFGGNHAAIEATAKSRRHLLSPSAIDFSKRLEEKQQKMRERSEKRALSRKPKGTAS